MRTSELPLSQAPPGQPAGTASDAEARSPADPRRWLVLAIIAVSQLMVVLDASIINIALPQAQAALDISNADRQWLVTAYTLGFGGLLLLGGRIADDQGRKRVFVIGLLGFAAASAIGGLAPSAPVLYAARALQGVFAAAMAPAALSLLATTFTAPKERATAFGVYGGISGGGAAIGLILGGLLTEYASWRWCLLVNVPIALVSAVFALRLITESRTSGASRYDVPGAATVTVGLVALVYGFAHAGSAGWGSAVTVGALVLAAVLLAAFVAVEARSAHPLLPLRVLASRERAGAYLAALLSSAGLFGMFLFLTYYLQGTLGYSALEAGFAFLPFSAGIVVGAGLTSQLLPKVKARTLLASGLVLACAGLLWFTGIGTTSAYLTHVLPAELLTAVGMGLVFVTVASAALVGVQERDSGVASALVNTSQQIGGSLGTALLNTLAATATGAYVTAHLGAAQARPSAQVMQAALVHGYQRAFAVGAAILALGALTTLLMLRRRRGEQPQRLQPAPAH
jgi:EmrB/QacA subfamily drug resistance transporter